MGEKRKKSWREIDKAKDRGSRKGHGKRDDKGTLEQALEKKPELKKQYLKEAEKLFMGAKGDPKHQKDLQAIHEAYGTPKFPAVVKRYVETYGLPDNWGALLLLLDLKDEVKIVCRAIEALCRLAEDKGSVERQGLVSKLKVLSLTAKDYDVRETAEYELTTLTRPS